MNEQTKILIEGMSCNHCVMNVKKAILSTGVENVNVVLEDNAAYIEGDFNADKIKEAVENVGYKYAGIN